jgi:coenzyme PQQ biosynthesis protein PqqD
MSLNLERCYRLAEKARLRWDPVRDAPFLIYPERGLKLNASAFALLSGCDGTASASAVFARVGRDFGVSAEQVQQDALPFLSDLVGRGLLVEVTP